MVVVANAGPLISLARIEQFALLHQLYTTVLIPIAVYAEVAESEGNRPGTEVLRAADWVQVVEVQDRTAVELLRERLDQGESEAIVLALERQADVLIIDELRGRRVAQGQGVKHIGTIGTLVVAKRQGLIEAVTPLLNALILAGFRMDKRLYQTALA